jgi:hypothetical protein
VDKRGGRKMVDGYKVFHRRKATIGNRHDHTGL